MVTTITTFQLPGPISLDEAHEVFMESVPKYQNASGLIRKYYLLSLDGATVSGVYLWEKQEDAEAMFTERWKDFVQAKYGTKPSLVFWHTSLVVDNLTTVSQGGN